MAVIDERNAPAEHPSYCPACGHLATGARFCSECGYALDARADAFEAMAEQTRVMPAAPAGNPSRSRVVPVVIAGALVLAAIAIAVVVLTSGSSSDPNGAYRQKLSTAVAPLVAANVALSSSLRALNGSDTQAAKTATSQAQQALVAARGAAAVLTVPSSSAQLSQQTQQALDQEFGYLQSVSATLSDPSGNAASGLQELASSTASAFVPLGSVTSGGQASLDGTDTLVSWAQSQATAQKARDAAAQRKALRKAAASGSNTTPTPSPPGAPGAPPTVAPSGYVTPSGDLVPGTWSLGPAAYASAVGTPYSWSGGQNCDQNIFAGDGTTCAFANNIFQVVAAAIHYGNPIPGSITAFDPASSTSYSLTCTEYSGIDNQTDVQCITDSGAGTAFPVWAANVYYG